jgi:hypothetical protein
MNNTFYYAKHDSEPTGFFHIRPDEAEAYNKAGHGIFYNIQAMKTCNRRMDNIHSIRCVAIDIDAGDEGLTKSDMQTMIANSPLRPTLVNESKNGYHLYWILKEDSRVVCTNNKREISKYYQQFLKERFIPLFKADKQACDVSRVLRVAGYYHMKDPFDPFLIQTVDQSNIKYSIQELKEAFPKIVTLNTYTPRPKPILEKGSDLNFCKELSILDVAHKYRVTPLQIGNRWKAKCTQPIHRNQDRTPSLVFYEETNSYYCYGCGKGGDVINFYQHYVEEVSFKEAIQNLRQDFGG